MFFSEFNGKILFAYSDPGGAKPILAIAESTSNNKIKIITDRDYTFTEDFLVQPSVISELEIESIFLQFSPNLVVTGTSYPASFERTCLMIASRKGIKSISYVDHYTRFNDRFRLVDGNYVIPDELWVIDPEATKIASESELVKSKIVEVGNPYRDWLKSWKPKFDFSNFLSENKIPTPKGRIILYTPDPLSNIDGKNKYGFDEVEVFEKLIRIKGEQHVLGNHYTLWFKTHPNQNMNLLSSYNGAYNNVVVIPSHLNTNMSIFYSDIVIGFFSSVLLEAQILGKLVYRYYPGDRDDPFGHLTNIQKLNDISLRKLFNCN